MFSSFCFACEHLGRRVNAGHPIDFVGRNLPARQDLNQKVDDKDAEIQKLKEQNEVLQKHLDNLEQMLKSITETK